MKCNVCGERDLSPIWLGEHDRDFGGPWHRCLCCGSDTSELCYADVRSVYRGDYGERFGSKADDGVMRRECDNNVRWFDGFRALAPQLSFLDVGCCEGTSMTMMREKGWEVRGFDVLAEAAALRDVVVGSRFTADLFDRRFGAVQLREVLEHVEDWGSLMMEIRQVLLPGGLFHVQTPRPSREVHGIPYQRSHIQLFSPTALRAVLQDHKFRVLGHELWDLGQLWMLRKEERCA